MQRILRTLAFFTLFLSFTLLDGCVSYPEQEFIRARSLVEVARTAEAPLHAEDSFKQAENLLSAANSAADNGNFREAKKLLLETEKEATLALAQAEEARSSVSLELEAVESASTEHHSENLSATRENSPPPFTQALASSSSPLPPKPLIKYTVGTGETLWSIAARSEIYADSLLWPLLYQANRDQIRDPRQIYPGQILDIPRSTGEKQKEEAREVARRSQIFPNTLLPASSR